MLNKYLKHFFITALMLLNLAAFAGNFSSDSLKLGQKVTGFTLDNASKNSQPAKVSLDSYHNQKGVVVIFMTNGCYHCINYRERIKALHTKYAAKGFPLITINPSNPEYAPEETWQEMQKNAVKENYQFPYLEDSDQKVTQSFGVRYTPEAFVLVKKAKDWIVAYVGPIDNDMENKDKNKITYVENVLNALLKHQKIPQYEVIK